MLQQSPNDRLTEESTAGSQLYQTYSRAIFAYLLKQVASREVAEDLLLDVFLAALEQDSLKHLNQQEQQRWLWMVARNKAADHFRRLARRPQVGIEQIAETIDEDEHFAPEQNALRLEEYNYLHTKIKELPTIQQEILQLRFAHNLPHAEIGLIIKKSEGTVRMILNRTLKKLRKLYQN